MITSLCNEAMRKTHNAAIEKAAAIAEKEAKRTGFDDCRIVARLIRTLKKGEKQWREENF